MKIYIGSFVIYKNYGYLYGGIGNQIYNDLNRINLKTLKWNSIE